MAARRGKHPAAAKDSSGCVAAIADIRALADKSSSTAEQFAEALAALAATLEKSRLQAIALVAETASNGVLLSGLSKPALRLVMVELCERLTNAASSTKPFDFSGVSTELISLLLPDTPMTLPAPVAPAEVVSAEVASIDDVQASEPATDGAPTQTSQPTEASLANQPAAIDAGVDDLDHYAICVPEDESLLIEFLNEAGDHINNAEQLLLVLETDSSNEEALNGVFRAVHSLKGASGVCELTSLGEVAHLAESLLVRIRDKQLELKDSLFRVTLYAVDFIGRQINSLRQTHRDKTELKYPLPPKTLMVSLEAAVQVGRVESSTLEQLAAIFCVQVKESEAKFEPNPLAGKSPRAISESIRVDAKRLELLVDLIGELVITEGFVQRELTSVQTLSAETVGSRLRKVIRDVQQLSLTLKMVPIGSLFQKLNRLVRDLSEQLGKPTRVIIEGSDTEVDKTLLECITDPLIHLVRNSIDHGIESNIRDRAAQGKPEVATIRFSAEHRSGSIHIVIADDGRGLDRKKILTRAIEKGIVPKNARLSDSEIDGLIFAPGFSTADIVSNVSGRGVGMDVVRKNIESLRGNVLVESESGIGTEIRLELPLTLSIIDGTVVRVGTRSFIIPTLSVVEQLQANGLELVETSSGDLLLFRGRHIAASQLGAIVNAEHDHGSELGQVCIVVEVSGRPYALLADQILGQQPIVIKPLGGILEDFGCYAGGALLSNGEIGFVLDLAEVCKHGQHLDFSKSRMAHSL